MRAFPVLLPLLLLCASCGRSEPDTRGEIASLKAEIEQLKSARTAATVAAAPELGEQMLTLQIRHGRLWAAGEAENWMLTQFQLAELRESVAGVVELNGDHAALQPRRLADVLPAIIDPALTQLQDAVDAQDKPKFEAAYDALSQACNECHKAAEHGFLVMQRPQTPVLDNLRP